MSRAREDSLLAARHAKLARLKELRKNYRMFFYKPYPKQIEFHTAGATYRERLFMAGNQLGKTMCAGHEVAFHATGLYPDGWAGRMFDRATRGWVAGPTAEMTRDGAQRILLGPVGNWGTGTIPKELIVDIKRARGVPDAVETILIRNTTSGDVSQITFKAQSDGREAFQSETLDWLWFDEEPPESIYTEAITRTNATTGPVFLTFTPLLGMSGVVMRFLGSNSPDRHVTNMTIDDVLHYTDEQKRKIIDQYPEHEREARTKGIPMLGSGRIYPVAEEVITEAPLCAVPAHWKQIIGMDFGWDHPTTAVHLAIDPDADCIHVMRDYRKSREMPLVHAAAVKPWGEWVPVAWPRDALQHDKGGSCEQLTEQYRAHGLRMVSEPASFGDKRGYGVEAGIAVILEMMRTSRFKVDANCRQWFDEFRMYHRKDGQIVKERDDLMDATRYGVMMRRFALPQEYAPQRRDRYAQRSTYGNTTWMSA